MTSLCFRPPSIRRLRDGATARARTTTLQARWYFFIFFYSLRFTTTLTQSHTGKRNTSNRFNAREHSHPIFHPSATRSHARAPGGNPIFFFAARYRRIRTVRVRRVYYTPVRPAYAGASFQRDRPNRVASA